jgi:hypothetical protein
MTKFDRLDVVRQTSEFFFSSGVCLVLSVMLSAVVRIEGAFGLMLGMDWLLWHVHCTDTNQASCTLRNY